MLTLGIESTCDETGFSVVKDSNQILSNLVASQIEDHSVFGGVVPELASRKHLEVAIPLLHQALAQANCTLKDIDLISVAMGPGLIGPLRIGMIIAKSLSLSLNIPFIGVNHVEAHLYASLMIAQQAPTLPALGIVLSGGHTAIISIENFGNYKILGATIDDAMGESFDKVASMLNLPYPGGPEIEAIAKYGDPKRYQFKAGKVSNNPLSFSFSGLKTAVLYTVKGVGKKKNSPLIIENHDKKDVAASFQYAAFNDLLIKTELALKLSKAKSLLFGGGVTQNKELKKLFDKKFSYFPQFWPSPELTLDNAAMIAGLGFFKYNKTKIGDSWDLEPKTRIPLDNSLT